MAEHGYRQLSRPTPIKSYVATVDLEGYLHLLSQVDGRIVGRAKVAGGPARADMISANGRLYILDDAGKLSAFELESSD